MTAIKKTRTNIMVGEFRLLKSHMEKGGGESVTVPDESMSIRDIMRKHVTGMKIAEAQQRQGFYEDDVDFDSPDLEKLSQSDIFDRAIAVEESKRKIEDLKQKQKQADQAKKDAEKKASQKPESAKSEARTKDAASDESEPGN